MKNIGYISAQKELFERVVASGLCTGCGACVSLCPYIKYRKDQIIFVDSCDLQNGKCYEFCPRTPTNLEKLRKNQFDSRDMTLEIGPVKELHLARASDTEIITAAQQGGTVSTLVELALKHGIVDAVILTNDSGSFLPNGVPVFDSSEVLVHSGSKFVVSPTLAAFNRLAKTEVNNIAVVATPCQALALSKVLESKCYCDWSKKVRLIIGLFCGWALSWRPFKDLLDEKIGNEIVTGFEIPPSRYHIMEVYIADGIIPIDLDSVSPCIRESCRYCFDLTAEFSDIAVGSARLPEGWNEARFWNQVIVRSDAGQELIELARTKGVLEIKPNPNTDKLMKASLNKKKQALKNLIKKSGDPDDLIYLDRRDPMFSTF